MELVTKKCINCHNFIFCYEDEDTKCQRCNYTIPASTPTANPALHPTDLPPQHYGFGPGIHIEYIVPEWARGTDPDARQQRIEELEAINAEMLAALAGFMRMCFEDLSGEESNTIIGVALAVIAKAKGESNG